MGEMIPASSSQEPIILDGKYALLSVLGKGAFGTVYEAEHLVVGKKAAIKVLHSELSDDEESRSRFVQEARAAACIGHANVVDIYDLGVTNNGDTYMVMELLDGQTMSEIISGNAPVEPGLACELMLQVLAGVAAAHDCGIVHRDLKPENIIVTYPRPGHPLVKVLDFGIAKGVGGEESLRDPNELIGSPMYMAPEQALGKPVDSRADVYSAGVILYELLCGKDIISAPSLRQFLTKVVIGDHLPLSAQNNDLDPALCLAVEHALATKPDLRTQTAPAFAEELLPYLEGVRGDQGTYRSFDPVLRISDAWKALQKTGVKLPIQRVPSPGVPSIPVPVRYKSDPVSSVPTTQRAISDGPEQALGRLREIEPLPDSVRPASSSPPPETLPRETSPKSLVDSLRHSVRDSIFPELDAPDSKPLRVALFATLLGFGVGAISAWLASFH